MDDRRQAVLDWAEQGRVAVPDVERALRVAGVLPDRAAWRHFIDRLLLWTGTLLLASGLIFFLAYNWQELGRFAKFGLAEGAILVALALVWRLGLDSPGGKAALLGASLCLGALLALIGQTYQTGADTFELFATWAAMILPWVLLGRCAALWLFWLALVNLAISLYFQAFSGIFGILFGTEQVLWLLFLVDSLALAAWEAAARHGIAWLAPRWGARLLATASGSLVTALAFMQVLDSHDGSGWALPAWLAWLTLAWLVYRRRHKDVFVLAGGVLSVILIVATFFIRHLSHLEAGGFLFVGLLVIGLSAAGGWWLKQVATEEAR